MTTNRVSVENPDDDDDRIYLTRPVTPLRLSQLLGIKPPEVITDLLRRDLVLIPYGLHDTVPDELAQDIARKYHRVLVIRDWEPNPDDKPIYLTRPVTVQDLCLPLGIKPHLILAELMMRNIFLNLQDTVPDELALEIARKYHRILVIRDKKPEV